MCVCVIEISCVRKEMYRAEDIYYTIYNIYDLMHIYIS